MRLERSACYSRISNEGMRCELRSGFLLYLRKNPNTEIYKESRFLSGEKKDGEEVGLRVLLH